MKKENKTTQVECNDRHCPIHGSISIRGRSFKGKIIKNDLHKTVTIEFPRQFYLSKYERYEKRRSRIKAHNSLCINAQIGDIVKIMETKPISKTKNFVVIEKCNQ
ncbi:MAG: 30S ribosomal protein S17 [Candidatus Woesearchaeota archaeon]|nr:30S ribosomal protein S17 [Candidatus Woesearchaeota archaeon]